MILVIGNRLDPVIARVTAALARRGAPCATIDEGAPRDYAIERTIDGGAPRWRIVGGDCVGRRAVGAIFLRHDVPATADRATIVAARALRRQLDPLLLATACRVVNPPVCAASNYSKPYQLRSMAAAGFPVPRTLVTNQPSAALEFIRALEGRVLFKGVGNVKTVPQLLEPGHLDKLALIERCPTQFQEFIAGVDVRVTVVGRGAVTTWIVDGTPDVATRGGNRARLPDAVLRRCIRYTRREGLVVSGIDLRRTPEGRIYAFELNPYPLFTHFEADDRQDITSRVARHLLQHDSGGYDLRA